MKPYLISYDLIQGKDYAALFETIKAAYPTHWRVLRSQWIVQTHESAKQIRDRLVKVMDHDDKLLVSLVTEAAWRNLGSAQADQWLISAVEAAH